MCFGNQNHPVIPPSQTTLHLSFFGNFPLLFSTFHTLPLDILLGISPPSELINGTKFCQDYVKNYLIFFLFDISFELGE